MIKAFLLYFSHLLFRIFEPVVRRLGSFVIPFGRTLHFYQKSSAARDAKIGDALLITQAGEFSNPLIPGRYKHLVIYVGDGWIESTPRGFIKQPFPSRLRGAKRACRIRPNVFTPEQALLFKEEAQKSLEDPFDPIPSIFRCSQLYQNLLRISGCAGVIPRRLFGLEVICPQDFYDFYLFHKQLEYQIEKD